MIELRVLAITGLLVTMVLVTVTAVGAYALGRWLGRVWKSRLRRPAVDQSAHRDVLRIRTHLISADAERRVRGRQAAWRLRC